MFDGFASHHTGRIHGSGSQQLLKRVGLMVSTCFNVFSLIFASARASLNRYLNRYLLLHITSCQLFFIVFSFLRVFTSSSSETASARALAWGIGVYCDTCTAC